MTCRLHAVEMAEDINGVPLCLVCKRERSLEAKYDARLNQGFIAYAVGVMHPSQPERMETRTR